MSSGATLPPPASSLDQGRDIAVRRVGRAVHRRLGVDAGLVIGVAIILTLMVAAALASVIAPFDPLEQDLEHVLVSPGTAGHLLGTDQLGRDVLSRLLYGARIDIFVALAAVISPFLIGTFLGILAGYRGGWLDTLEMRIVDVFFAFPPLVLLIALVFVLSPGVVTIIVSVTLVNWVVYARLARGAAQREATMEYVLAAQVGGIPQRRILVRHILPNIISQSIVYAMSDAVLIITFITALGFLGLGVPPPAADWGSMISEARPYFSSHPLLSLIPGLVILVTGLGLSMIADSLAQRIDKR
jgi:peptide/nickel transport system permease protein